MMKVQTISPFGGVAIGTGDLPSVKEMLQRAAEHKVLLLRGFDALAADKLRARLEASVKLHYWASGPIMEMKVSDDPKNYLFTPGRVPFHWDGAFAEVPRFLFFHCIEAPNPDAGGETFFIDGQAVYEASTEEEKAAYRKISLTYQTEKKAHYGGDVSIDLVQPHPDTAKPLVRFAEPVDETYLNPVSMTVSPDTPEAKAHVEHLIKRCYQSPFMLTHQWQEGDYLIVDNQALLHGRHAFSGQSPRHLRRLQIL